MALFASKLHEVVREMSTINHRDQPQTATERSERYLSPVPSGKQT